MLIWDQLPRVLLQCQSLRLDPPRQARVCRAYLPPLLAHLRPLLRLPASDSVWQTWLGRLPQLQLPTGATTKTFYR